MAEKTTPIRLPELVDGDFASSFIAAASHSGAWDSFAIDASQVERVTTVGIQPLVAWMRQVGASNAASVILHASPAFRAAWADFGLNHHFPLEQ